MDVKSSPSTGTTISVYLPSVMEEARPESIEEASTVDSPASGETILVVEDEEAVRQFTETLLVELGYRVLTAENGEHALRVSQEYGGKIDLLLSDVVMPKIGVFETAEIIRESRPDMKIVFMSGYPNRDNTEISDALESAQFLQKPVRAAHLVQVIRQEIDGADLTFTS